MAPVPPPAPLGPQLGRSSALSRFVDVHPGEGRVVAGASVVLALIVAAHVLLETARDAVFLTKLSPSALPAVYVAMGALGFLTGSVDRVSSRLVGRKNALVLGLMAAATGTMLFYSQDIGQIRAFALYLWSGVITTLLTVQFWLGIAQRMTPAQGRRLYGLLAAGGVLGGVIGSTAGALLAQRFSIQSLLLAAAAAHLGAAWLVTAAPPATELTLPPKRVRMAEGMGVLRNNSYLIRVGVLVQVSVATLLLVDYVFKMTMATRLPPAELGVSLARFYAAMNAVALVVQIFITMRILQRMGTVLALTVLPLALLVSGLFGLVFSTALLFALLAKGADGSLRFSLHRVSTELLFLPLGPDERARTRPFFDGVLTRGTQALVAVSILFATRFLDARASHFAVAIAVLALLWVGLAWSLRASYLERFRATLGGSVRRPGYTFLQLDLDSVAVLVEALSSPDENRVITAMSLFHEEGRSNLVPALVLYHPSPRVLMRALEILPAPGRSDWIPLAERLLGHQDDQVRLAAIQALGSSGHLAHVDPAIFGTHPSVAATAAFFLAEASEEPAEHSALAEILAANGDLHGQIALLNAIAHSSTRNWANTVQKLDALGRPELDQALPAAMAQTRDPRFIPVLVRRLSHREGRSGVRNALVAFGDPALDALEEALYDLHTPPAVRLHIPRAISTFASRAAGDILLDAMNRDLSGALRYKALRGLGRLVANDKYAADSARILPLIELNLSEYTRLSSALEALRARPSAPPLSGLLFFGLLEDKMRQALERALRLYQILHPREDFRRVFAALVSDDAQSRVAAMEILEVTSLAYGEELRGLLRLVSDGHTKIGTEGDTPVFDAQAELEVLTHLIADADPLLAAVAASYSKELDRAELEPAIEQTIRSNTWLLENGPVATR